MSQESQSWKSSFKITKTNGRGSGEISKNESERKCHRLPSQVTKQPSVEITESLSELPRGVVDPQSPAATWSSAGFCFPDERMNTSSPRHQKGQWCSPCSREVRGPVYLYTRWEYWADL